MAGSSGCLTAEVDMRSHNGSTMKTSQQFRSTGNLLALHLNALLVICCQPRATGSSSGLACERTGMCSVGKVRWCAVLQGSAAPCSYICTVCPNGLQLLKARRREAMYSGALVQAAAIHGRAVACACTRTHTSELLRSPLTSLSSP